MEHEIRQKLYFIFCSLPFCLLNMSLDSLWRPTSSPHTDKLQLCLVNETSSFSSLPPPSKYSSFTHTLLLKCTGRCDQKASTSPFSVKHRPLQLVSLLFFSYLKLHTIIVQKMALFVSTHRRNSLQTQRQDDKINQGPARWIFFPIEHFSLPQRFPSKRLDFRPVRKVIRFLSPSASVGFYHLSPLWDVQIPFKNSHCSSRFHHTFKRRCNKGMLGVPPLHLYLSPYDNNINICLSL